MKRLTNRTSGFQFLRIAFGPYNATQASTKKVPPHGTVDLTDAEYRSVGTLPASIWDVLHIDDDLPDTNQEVLDLINTASGHTQTASTVLNDSSVLGSTVKDAT